MFLLIKKDPKTGRTYTVYIQSGKELGDHIKACYELSEHEVIGVVRIA